MYQQTFDPSQVDDAKQIEQKVIILLFIEKMGEPVSQNQVTEFALEENYMNIYHINKYLTDMTGINYLDAFPEGDQIFYDITEEGLTALNVCLANIPAPIRGRIARYAAERRPAAKEDFFSAANYLVDIENGEYTVKCGAYENGRPLLEISLNVVTIEQAAIICNNWKQNMDDLYPQILGLLLKRPNLCGQQGTQGQNLGALPQTPQGDQSP